VKRYLTEALLLAEKVIENLARYYDTYEKIGSQAAQILLYCIVPIKCDRIVPKNSLYKYMSGGPRTTILQQIDQRAALKLNFKAPEPFLTNITNHI
jgi:hypothetical protein